MQLLVHLQQNSLQRFFHGTKCWREQGKGAAFQASSMEAVLVGELLQPPSHLFQHGVASPGSENGIDYLEVLQLDQGQTAFGQARRGRAVVISHPGAQIAGVGQPGELVVIGQEVGALPDRTHLPVQAGELRLVAGQLPVLALQTAPE